jgi:hypothetical protein
MLLSKPFKIDEPKGNFSSCGGGFEHLHRSLASRRRRRKGNPVPWGTTGSALSLRDINDRPNPIGWAGCAGGRGVDSRLTKLCCRKNAKKWNPDAIGQNIIKKTIVQNGGCFATDDESKKFKEVRTSLPFEEHVTFWERNFVSSEKGPLSLESTIEELVGRKSSGSGLENREYERRDPSRWLCDTPYPQKLALTSPTSGSLSVGIVCSRTEATEYSFSF